MHYLLYSVYVLQILQELFPASDIMIIILSLIMTVVLFLLKEGHMSSSDTPATVGVPIMSLVTYLYSPAL